MDNLLIGRKSHIEELENALTSNKPEMVALVGRRRVGKTYLVGQVYANRIDFELTGRQHGDMDDQITNFVVSMRQFFPNFSVKDTL